MPTIHDQTAISIAMQIRTPVFLWGPPGVGKTAMLESITAALKERLHTVLLSVREPQDQGGLPVITPQGVVLHPPRWARDLVDDGGGTVFFDEFNGANPQTQLSALRLIYGGYAGDLKLPEQTSFVMAGNRPSEAAGVYELTSGISNRIVHFDIKPNPDEWRQGSIAGWPVPEVRRIGKNWHDGYSSKIGLVCGFIGVKPGLLSDQPVDQGAQGKAWPSGRTWDYVAELLAACDSIGLGPRSIEARLLISGAVGPGAGSEFVSWLVNLDLPDPEDILANPLKIDIPRRQDQVMALLDSVASAAIDRSRTDRVREGRYYAAWKFIGRLCKEGTADLCIPAARSLAKNMPASIDKSLPPEVEFILPILKKANINFSREA